MSRPRELAGNAPAPVWLALALTAIVLFLAGDGFVAFLVATGLALAGVVLSRDDGR